MIFTSDSLYRNTPNTWVYPNNIPATLIRYVNVVLTEAADIYVQEVSCSAGKLSIVLVTQDGTVVASCKTNEPNAIVNMIVRNSDICVYAYVYTGALVTEYKSEFYENRPVLIGDGITLLCRGPVSTLMLNDTEVVLESDINIVLDELYYNGVLSENLLSINWSDNGKALTTIDPMYVDTVDCVYTINNIGPDEDGNIFINMVNTNNPSSSIPITAKTPNQDADTVVCYIDTDDSFISMCMLDDPTYVGNAFNKQTIDSLLPAYIVKDEATGGNIFDIDAAEKAVYEQLASPTGLSLYETNPDCDAEKAIAHALKCEEKTE